MTVQKICRVAKNEKDVRALLDEIWEKPKKAKETLSEALNRNQKVFEFENKICN